MSPRPFPFTDVRWVWVDGELVPFAEARVHLLAHSLHYASGVFEGIRCYQTPRGPAVFRLREHVERLIASCKVLRYELPYDAEELCRAVVGLLRANELAASYIRPLVLRGFGNMSVNPLHSPIVVAIAAWPPRPGAYLGEAAENGIDVCVSSWRRVSAESLPTNAKATANYLNSQLIKMEAEANGYAEGIGLDEEGRVSEGSAENLFMVHRGALWTPPVASSILVGVTRDCVLTLARDAGLAVREEVVPRSLLYVADELFFTGTSVEVTPIRSVDRITIGAGRPGEITRRLAAELLGIARGELPDRHGWLWPVD